MSDDVYVGVGEYVVVGGTGVFSSVGDGGSAILAAISCMLGSGEI